MMAPFTPKPWLNILTLLLLMAALPHCQSPRSPRSGAYLFPQGVASADPQPAAVTLWTRVVPTGEHPDSIALEVQMSKTADFVEPIHIAHTAAYPDHDFTLRYHAGALEPGETYFYRFIAGIDTSRVGRTFTAPGPDQSASLNFATLACSSYEQGFYGTLQRLIEEDRLKPASEQLQLIFHLGDFIYEVVGDDPRNDNHSPKWLVDAQGRQRNIPPFPHGKQWPASDHWKSGSWSPVSLADYRHLYQVYLANPVMREARARWPFVYTWDDHEFADGNYQSNSYIGDHLGMEGMQQVKVAANQAWFEYLPATLSRASSLAGVTNQAHDFRPTAVQNAPLGETKEQGLYTEPNNLRAINSLSIYRALQWGKDILILVTDTKSYQDPGQSVLGSEQKAWFKALLRSSEADWKLWLNSEPILEAYVDFGQVGDPGMDRALLYRDSWKSAAAEREELLTFIKEQRIGGVVSLSGDYHIQMAATVGPSRQAPVLADFAVTALSAFPDFFWLDRKGKNLGDSLLHKLFSYQDAMGQWRPNINTTVLYGAQAALEMARTNDFRRAMVQADTTINPYLRYFDCEHNGYLTGTLDRSLLRVTFVNTENARTDHEQAGAPVVSSVRFTLPSWSRGEIPELSAPTVEGAVFPLSQRPGHE